MLYPFPLLVPKDQTIQNTHDCLQKTVLMMWTPPHRLRL